MTIERLREQPYEKESYSFGKVLQAALKNRPLIGIIVATIGCMMALASNSGPFDLLSAHSAAFRPPGERKCRPDRL